MAHYIVFDLEFNQDLTSEQITGTTKASYPFEIIQIGAIKLDKQLSTLAYFNRYVKPTIYSKISPFITDLTGITTEQLHYEETFPEVYQAFIDFMGDPDAILLSWGNSDIKELYRMAVHFQMDLKLLPKHYIDLQPYASLYLKHPKTRQLRLQYTVEQLLIPQPYPFHSAVHDAYYTAEVYKKIKSCEMQVKIYDPFPLYNKAKLPKQGKFIDYDALYLQFEKMFYRPITIEEKQMIKLAYQMGKTGQFIKMNDPKLK